MIDKHYTINVDQKTLHKIKIFPKKVKDLFISLDLTND